MTLRWIPSRKDGNHHEHAQGRGRSCNSVPAYLWRGVWPLWPVRHGHHGVYRARLARRALYGHATSYRPVLAVSTDKQQALADARRLLRAANTLTKREAANDSKMEQTPLWDDELLPPVSTASAKPKAIPRRRREVFERSDGRCFYCGTVLTLEGTWHVEHQLPRALMGKDELPNLVAACVPCNLAKSDSTAFEFITQRDAQG